MAVVIYIELLPNNRLRNTAIEVIVYIKPESITIFMVVVSLLRNVENWTTFKSSRAAFSLKRCQILYTIIAIAAYKPKVNL